MKLVYKAEPTREVAIGDTHIVRGQEYVITGIRKPEHGGSTGRVYLDETGDSDAGVAWYPSVIGAEWIEREDRQDD